jgi:hypothetical protein
MPDESAPAPRKRSTWDRVALLAAALISVTLLLSLCGNVAFVFVLDKPDETRWTTAQTEMAEITKALNKYSLDHAGAYPPSLAPLTTTYFPNGVPKDPFSKGDYHYERTSSDFTLVCLGKDLKPGGAEVPERDVIFDETGQIAP